MPKKHQCGLRDIAARLNLSAMTVSLSLRDRPSIPEATRERVKKVATEMGYRPKALLGAMLADVRRGGSESTVFAWIDILGPSQFHAPWFRGYLEGATAKAEELGIRLDVFSLRERMRTRRLGHILKARGILGVIVGPGGGRQHLNMEWDGFSCLAVGRSLWRPDLHRVVTDDFQNMGIALRQMVHQGYRRIGLYLSPFVDRETQFNYSSRFLKFQETLPKYRQVPILYEARIPGQTHDPYFQQWLHRWKPDALLCHTKECEAWLQEGGLEVPGDIGLAHLMLSEHVADWSGIDQAHYHLGEMAIIRLLSLVSARDTGIPATPTSISSQGKWVISRTLGRKHPASKSSPEVKPRKKAAPRSR